MQCGCEQRVGHNRIFVYGSINVELFVVYLHNYIQFYGAECITVSGFFFSAICLAPVSFVSYTAILSMN